MGYGQSLDQARSNGRLERRFWSWSDENYQIVEVSAFAADENPPKDGYWWVPQLGFSGSERFHLFTTKRDAARAAYALISTQIQRLEALRDNIDRKALLGD